MVCMCEIFKHLQRADHKEDVNCAPRSEVMDCGTPNLAIQAANRACAQSAAEVFTKGTASNQRVDLSIIVNRYLH